MAVAPAVAEEFKFPDEQNNEAPKGEDENLEVSIEGEGDIEIVDDTPPEDRGRKVGVSGHIDDVSDDELKQHSEQVQKRLKELSFARHDERRAKEVAQRERAELEQLASRALDDNRRLRAYVHDGEKVYQGTAKAAAAAKLENAKAQFKKAHEDFDADAMIVAQQALTSAQLELAAAENFRPTTLQPPEERVERQPTQPVLDERVKRWQDRNQWFGVNRRMTAYALSVHQELVDDGVDPRSDDYYKRLDADLRGRFPENFGERKPESQDPPPVHRKPANVVAPTARSSSAKKITITQTGANLAKKLGIPVELYAQHVAELEKNNGR